MTSGKSRQVQRRYACPKFIRQTFHEFAEKSILYCSWAKAFYRQRRDRGQRHNAVVRALAFKWIRIIYRLWQNSQTYDDAKYQQALIQRNSPLATQNA